MRAGSEIFVYDEVSPGSLFLLRRQRSRLSFHDFCSGAAMNLIACAAAARRGQGMA